MSKRIVVFIDGSNFYHSIKLSFNKTNVDITKFITYLSQDNNLIVIKYYSAAINQFDDLEEYKKQQKYFDYLNKVKRLDLYLGRLEKRPNSHKVEKGVDVKLAIDLLSLAYHDIYDIAIIISNDSDFVPAIKEIQNLGKQAYNVSFPATKCYHLNKVCDKTIKINNIDNFLKL